MSDNQASETDFIGIQERLFERDPKPADTLYWTSLDDKLSPCPFCDCIPLAKTLAKDKACHTIYCAFEGTPLCESMSVVHFDMDECIAAWHARCEGAKTVEQRLIESLFDELPNPDSEIWRIILPPLAARVREVLKQYRETLTFPTQ